MRVELDEIGDCTQQVVLPKSELRKALNCPSNHSTDVTRQLSQELAGDISAVMPSRCRH